jgi:PKD repeat protein
VEDGIYTVTVTVTDSAGGVGLDGVTVTVNNVAPVVDAGPDRTTTGILLLLGRVVKYTDPGVGDTHTAAIDWGDGTVESAIVDQSAMTVEGSHRYDETGVYTVTFTVTDDDGGSGSDSLLIDVQVAPAVVSIPGLSTWGLAALGGALGLLLVVRVRRRAALR